METFVTIVASAIGSLGFALLFGLKKKHLFFATLGGIISWASYLVLMYLIKGEHIFVCCFITTIIGAAYCGIISHRVKAPMTLFLIPMVVPLIPGSALYYTFLNFYYKNWSMAFAYGGKTLSFAFAIAAGMGVSWELKRIKRNSKKRGLEYDK